MSKNKGLPTSIEFESIVLRRWDAKTGKELDPYIEFGFMQDRLNIRPGDLVSVKVKVKIPSKRQRSARNE